MKKSIFVFGIVTINLMLFGSIFKIMHWPSASVLLILSIFCFCFLFFPLALKSNYDSQEEKPNKWLYFTTFIVFFMSMITAIFKIQHWPGASTLLMIEIPLPFVLFLPMYLYHTRKDENKSLVNQLGIMFGLTFVAVFSALLSVNFSKNVTADMSYIMKSYENSFPIADSNIHLNSEDDDFSKSALSLETYLTQLKCDVLEGTGHNLCIANHPVLNWEEQIDPTLKAHKLITSILSPKSGEDKLTLLKSKIAAFKVEALSKSENNKDLQILINNLFELEDRQMDYGHGKIRNIPWEIQEFSNQNLSNVLTSFNRIQSNVRFVNNEIGG